MCPITRFVRCADYLEFWMGLGKNLTKRCDQLHVFAVQTNLSFWWDLEKIWQKGVTSYTFSQCRLTWVFDGTWSNFHKKVCPVICFFAVETNLSFWWDLEQFSQKSVPSYTFFRSACYFKFWIRLRKVSTKLCAQLHVFAVHAILSFG